MQLQRKDIWKLAIIIATLHALTFFGTASLMQQHGASMKEMILKMDQVQYLQLADTMLDYGRFALSPQSEPELFRTPGYPITILAVETVTQRYFWGIFLFHVILLGFLAAVVGLTASRIGLTRNAALTAGGLMGISSGSFLLSLTGMGSDILYTVLYACAAYVAISAQSPHTSRQAVYLGLLLGLATLVRPIGILASVPLLIGFALLDRERLGQMTRRVAIASLAWIIVITPWCIRNFGTAHVLLLSTVSTFNVAVYNIPMNENFWRGTGEKEGRSIVQSSIGAPTLESMRGATYLARMKQYNTTYLEKHFFEYGIFHLYRTLPFFFMSGFNVINALISHEAPSLRTPLFPTENENLTRLVAEHRWNEAVKALSHYWFTTLERLSCLVAIMAAFTAPVLARGRTRRILILFAVIIVTNILLVSPVTQARYRVPVEPFIWIGAVFTAQFLWRRWRFRTGNGMLDES